jgi:hypothetical protein
MSEKIYAWLLRLYPYRFRETYGEDALQLVRDRLHDERGFFLRVRLWLDLLADLAISVPREYRTIQPALTGTLARKPLDGTPSFHVLDDESPRFGSFLFGSVLSVAALAGFSLILGHAGDHRPPRMVATKVEHSGQADSAPLQSMEAQPSTEAGEASRASGQLAQLRSSQGTARPPTRAAADDTNLDAAERHHVIDAVVANLKAHYVDPGIAGKMADALLAHEKNGDDTSAADGDAFAKLLTTQLRDVSSDMHLVVVYSRAPLPARPPGPTPDGLARYREALQRDNCTFKQVEMLPHNIGYLKLNSFPDASICQSTATAAMASLNRADALIFDLRDNGGGFSEMVSLIAAYLFDHPEYMYDPRIGPAQQSWTQSPVPGNRLANKPVYVLTSGSTVSAAEQFTYDLKMLKRVTLVGETTRGSAHAGVFHRIDDHFGMGIPETRAVNPYSKTDWEGVGVEPDVKVNAADALKTAEQLAESKLRRR